jgi:tetratricopeptide (TPR) repeat protein
MTSKHDKRRFTVDPEAVAALKSLWAEETEADETCWAYREAAAVLDTFDAQKIRPFGAKPLPNGYPAPEKDASTISATAGDKTKAQWRLAFDVRQEALERLGSKPRMQAALKANPERPDTPMQKILEAVVTETVPALESLSREELSALLNVSRWLETVLPTHELPDASRLAVAFARADLLAPCRHLLMGGFVDRTRQLEKLKAFLWQEEPSPPMLLHGIGGIGKSTLLAKLTLDEIADNGDRLLLVPIDVDRPRVRPHHPYTFLREAVAQIVRQVPELAGAGESMAHHLRELGARYSVSQEGEEFESTRYSEKDVDFIQSEMIDAFHDFLTPALPSTDGRVLITIDTFEEAQVLGSDVAEHLVSLFDQLARSCPTARIVFSGRVRADDRLRKDGKPVEEHEELLPGAPYILLKSLDKRSALSLLASQLKEEAPRPNRKDLEDVLAVVGQNPMCIKLAARIIQLEGTDALFSDKHRAELITHLRDAKIQAFLFGRILDHFQTERIKPLAYPGLIVRRVTPDIIRQVLAEPCGIELENPAEAEALYEDLARERTMVEGDRACGLRYRPELRREVLVDVLDKVSKETAEAIDRHAIEFYHQDDSREARAEEIYHRLRLGENLDVIDSRWMPGLRNLLRSSLGELPEAGRLWLSRKLNITVDSTVRDAASQSDWENIAKLRAERFLKRGDADRALEAVRERVQRVPNSPLFQIESEALRLAGELSAARQVASRGLESASGDRRAELLLQLASLHEIEQELDLALPLIVEATEVAEGRDDPMLPFRTLVTQVRVLRKLGRLQERDALEEKALDYITRDTMKELRLYPRLFEETAAELGDKNQDMLQAAVQRLGVHTRNAEQQVALTDAFHTIWKEGLETQVSMPKNLDPKLVLNMGAMREAAEELVRESEGAGLGGFVADLLRTEETPQSEGASRIVDFFRESVEQGLDSVLDNKKN